MSSGVQSLGRLDHREACRRQVDRRDLLRRCLRPRRCGRAGRRARPRPAPGRSASSAGQRQVQVPQAVQRQQASWRRPTSRRPCRPAPECAWRCRCGRRAWCRAAACSARAARSTRSSAGSGVARSSRLSCAVAAQLEVQRVAPVDQHEDRLQQVVAVGAAAGDVQEQVELGRRRQVVDGLHRLSRSNTMRRSAGGGGVVARGLQAALRRPGVRSACQPGTGRSLPVQPVEQRVHGNGGAGRCLDQRFDRVEAGGVWLPVLQQWPRRATSAASASGAAERAGERQFAGARRCPAARSRPRKLCAGCAVHAQRQAAAPVRWRSAVRRVRRALPVPAQPASASSRPSAAAASASAGAFTASRAGA